MCIRDRFFYEYNFFAGWRADLRVEEIVAAEPGRGVSALHRRAASRPTRGLGRTVGVPRRHPAAPGVRRDATRRRDRGQLLDADPDAEPATVGVDRDELTALLPLLGLERFDRRGLNRALADLATTTETKPS